MPNRLKSGVIKDRLRRRLLKIAKDCRLNIAAARWWNQHRPQFSAIDCEGDRVLLSLARRCLAAIDAGDMQRVASLVRQIGQQAVRNVIDGLVDGAEAS